MFDLFDDNLDAMEVMIFEEVMNKEKNVTPKDTKNQDKDQNKNANRKYQ